jgi:hypothetical protein
MAQKLSETLAVVYDVVEGITPHYDASAPFVRWRSLEPIETGDVAACFRNFRVAVPSTGKGSLQDSSTKRSKKALVQIKVLYPLAYYPDGDTDYLGVEMLREDDGCRIVNALCFARPLALQDQVSDVRSIKWLGSALSGRLWVISLEIEYLETIS